MSGGQYDGAMNPFSLESLRVPVVQAPMAGGPSTPRLAAAVTDAGGLGSLAAGYLTADATAHALAEYRSLTTGPVALNIFVPEAHRADAHDLAGYRSALQDWTDSAGIDGAIPPVGEASEDLYAEKLAVAMDERPDIVSFTFGLPDVVTIERLHEVGITVAVTVTNPAEGRVAHSHGADLLIAQGIEAGGHRAQFDQSARPQEIPTGELVAALVDATPLAVIAAGGVDGPDSAQSLLDRGAGAVQMGTLFLTTEESGTKPTHRRALLHAAASDRPVETTLTRVFTGRPARALVNRFTDEMAEASVVGYPQVNVLTSGIRSAAAAADDPQLLNLWSGTGAGGCREESAAALVTRFSTLERPDEQDGGADRARLSGAGEEDAG